LCQLIKNYFRILDKKEYELKDHLGNVRVAIGDMKLPENEATSTRGLLDFPTWAIVLLV